MMKCWVRINFYPLNLSFRKPPVIFMGGFFIYLLNGKNTYLYPCYFRRCQFKYYSDGIYGMNNALVLLIQLDYPRLLI